jgi:hypothetical protein
MVPTNGAAVHSVASSLDGGDFRHGVLDSDEHIADVIPDVRAYDQFHAAVRAATRKSLEERHGDLLKTNARQLQKLVEHDSTKAALESTAKQRDRYAAFAEDVVKRCEALIALYPAGSEKREDQGGKSLKAIHDLVAQAKALKKG